MLTLKSLLVNLTLWSFVFFVTYSVVVAPNKYSVWTGAGYYGGTPVPIPNVREPH
jgi:hypothetical protein